MNSQIIRVMLVTVFLAAATSCGKPERTSTTQDPAPAAGLEDDLGAIQRAQNVVHRDGRTIDLPGHSLLAFSEVKVDDLPLMIPFVSPPTDKFLTNAQNEEKQGPWRDLVDNIFSTNFVLADYALMKDYDAESGHALLTTPLERPLKTSAEGCEELDRAENYVITVAKNPGSTLFQITHKAQLAQIKDLVGLDARENRGRTAPHGVYASVPIPSTLARQIEDVDRFTVSDGGLKGPSLNWYFSLHLDGPNSYERASCKDHDELDLLTGRKVWQLEVRDFIGATLNYAVLEVAWADGGEFWAPKIVKREVIGVWISPSYSDADVRADLADQLFLAGEIDQWESLPSWEELLPHAQRYSSDENIEIGEYAKTPALTAILIGNLPNEVSEAWANAQLGDYKTYIPLERD